MEMSLPNTIEYIWQIGKTFSYNNHLHNLKEEKVNSGHFTCFKKKKCVHIIFHQMRPLKHEKYFCWNIQYAGSYIMEWFFKCSQLFRPNIYSNIHWSRDRCFNIYQVIHTWYMPKDIHIFHIFSHMNKLQFSERTFYIEFSH